MSHSYTPPTPPFPLPIKEAWPLLGHISPEKFMREYWQKKPLLVRGAIPAFQLAIEAGRPLESPISTKELLSFATHDAVETRLVKANPWRLDRGPLAPKSIPKMGIKNWTILLQGMEGHHEAAAKILSWFRFIPDSRLDDLMISLASPGGGVGPHLDSYDVFLIQMSGRRRWRISTQTEHRFVEDVPLRILSNFKTENEWVVEPGDLLYLPPKVAHDGVALDPDTQTWSVGFRAPSWKELLQETLWHLAESLDDDPALAQILEDPYQPATQTPAAIPQSLINNLRKYFEKLPLQGNRLGTLLEEALGKTLSEPKPQVIFDSPDYPMSADTFLRAVEMKGLQVSPKTRIIANSKTIFCNGEVLIERQDSLSDFKKWEKFSHQRMFTAKECKSFFKIGDPLFEISYEAYLDGWFELGQ